MSRQTRVPIPTCVLSFDTTGSFGEEIAAAVSEQIRKLPFYPHAQINVPATQLATRLAEILPGDLQHLFFCNSGSEANETALKIVRQYGRQKYPGQNRFKVFG